MNVANSLTSDRGELVCKEDRLQEKVLFTLSTKERFFFLPDFSSFDLGNADVVFFPACEYSEEEWEEMLFEFQPTVVVTNWSSRMLPPSYLLRAECRTRYVCHMAGTVRSIIPRAYLENGGIVSNWGGLVGAQVAEHALLLALGILRGQQAWRSYMLKPHSWEDWPVVDIGTRTLFSKNVGIHGFGNVARTLVRLLKPFGVHITVWSEGVPNSLFQEYAVTPASSLKGLFSSSDVIFECEALNERTFGSVDASVLAQLPDGAVFVNIARGQVVCEKSLLHEARNGRIQVALDVLSEEHAASESPFLQIPEVILSPHIAGPTSDQYSTIGQYAVTNIHRYLAGKMPEGLVTLEQFDRST